MSRFVSLFVLFGVLALPAFAFDPSAATTQSQKQRALKLFNEDAKVLAEIQSLEKNGYQLLTTESVPYYFAYGDEGPHTRFVVTAWLGKGEQYGWTAKFVTARVNTDGFSNPATRVQLLDQAKLQQFLR